MWRPYKPFPSQTVFGAVFRDSSGEQLRAPARCPFAWKLPVLGLLRPQVEKCCFIREGSFKGLSNVHNGLFIS